MVRGMPTATNSSGFQFWKPARSHHWSTGQLDNTGPESGSEYRVTPVTSWCAPASLCWSCHCLESETWLEIPKPKAACCILLLSKLQMLCRGKPSVSKTLKQSVRIATWSFWSHSDNRGSISVRNSSNLGKTSEQVSATCAASAS